MLTVFCSERERPFFVPSPTIRFAERAEGVKGPKPIKMHSWLMKRLHCSRRQRRGLRHSPNSLISFSGVFLRLTVRPMFCTIFMPRIGTNINEHVWTASFAHPSKNSRFHQVSGHWRTTTTNGEADAPSAAESVSQMNRGAVEGGRPSSAVC